MHHAGLYAWGGPGTIRLLKVKYHAPRIDEASFMRLYEPDYLAEARHKLGVTDMWVTYSWGFSDRTEQPDRDYVVRRLSHFHRQGIRPYAYVQGLNVVTDDFAGQDVFCRDAEARPLLYSKGRTLTCPNKPEARRVILDRVQAACREDFSGVYVDNVLFGLPPFYVRRDYTSFFGCACDHCRRAFHDRFGYALPVEGVSGEDALADYLDFRCQSVFDLLRDLSDAAHSAGKRFGVNLYDPYWMSPELYFGYRLDQIQPLLDYYMIENHALERVAGINNRHLAPLITSEPRKPTFVVSYHKGIGYDAVFGQREVDTIWSEAASLGYAPCLKATEYVTKGRWHALDLADLEPPTMTTLRAPTKPLAAVRLRSSLPVEQRVVRVVSRYYPQLARLAFENRFLADGLARTRIMASLFRKPRPYRIAENG